MPVVGSGKLDCKIKCLLWLMSVMILMLTGAVVYLGLKVLDMENSQPYTDVSK